MFLGLAFGPRRMEMMLTYYFLRQASHFNWKIKKKILKDKSQLGMINAMKQTYQQLTQILTFVPYCEAPDDCKFITQF